MEQKKKSKMKTPEFRVSFPNLLTPKGFGDQKPKYSVTMLIPKTVDISALKKMVSDAALEMWPDPTKRPKKIINPIKDGDTDEMDSGELRVEKYPEVAGHWVISASSLNRIPVLDKDMSPIMDADVIYSGCFAYAVVTAFAYGPNKNRPQSKSGVSFGLQGIQKSRDGERFAGGGIKADDFFAPITGEDPSNAAESMFS